jgi:hypothetical protein
MMDFIFSDGQGNLYAKASDAEAFMSKGLEKQLQTVSSKEATVLS